MLSRPAVVTFIVIVAEVFTAKWMLDTLGLGWTALALIACSVLGVVVLRRHISGLARAARTVTATTTVEVSREALGVLGGLLLLVPGFLTSAVGLALLFGPLRTLLAHRFRTTSTRWVQTVTTGPVFFGRGPGGPFGPSGPRADHTIIDVDIIDTDPTAGMKSDAPRSVRRELD